MRALTHTEREQILEAAQEIGAETGRSPTQVQAEIYALIERAHVSVNVHEFYSSLPYYLQQHLQAIANRRWQVRPLPHYPEHDSSQDRDEFRREYEGTWAFSDLCRSSTTYNREECAAEYERQLAQDQHRSESKIADAVHAAHAQIEAGATPSAVLLDMLRQLEGEPTPARPRHADVDLRR